MRILFVDDEAAVLKGLERMLFASAPDDWELAFADGGVSALHRLERERFDVLVTDMRMPDMNGAVLLEQVHKKYPGVARIVLSGQTSIRDALRAIPISHQFLAKPCSAEQVVDALRRCAALEHIALNPQIAAVVGRLGALPVGPKVYFELNRVLADPNRSLHDVAAVVERDAGVTARVLHVANSAFFAGTRRVFRLVDAIARLGIGVVKAMVLSAEAERGLKVAGKAGALVERLSEHSLAVTRCAGRLAMALAPEEHACAVADEAALGAALHEVGLLVLAATHPDELLRLERDGRLRDVRLEREVLGLGHPEIGAYLCGLWGLPYAVGETIRWHHEPEGLLGRGVDPATVVALADAICGGATTEAVSDLLAQFGIDAEPGGLVGLGKTQDSDER